ncbi:hypothetical protein DRF75_04025 [Ehrlichia minasensis]|uniref:Uncharacterized protein n=1 Tax=Ehrlichia minasensis TaxID=1242993 RepID=A0A4Q6I3P7_9RICK|nr:hypothetical protein [Ehrlichia minasensis]RZB12461.1 hypothetical protein DRF75_04025 [Ehrlichia minasensis]CEI84966.1 Uncharacterized protein ehr_00343 [Ehrlichia minasensis]
MINEVYFAIVSILIFIIFILIIYSILKKCRDSKKDFGVNNGSSLPVRTLDVSDCRIRNSVICDLKKELKVKMKELYDNGTEFIEAKSPQHGVLMVKVGFKYVQDQIFNFIDRIDNDKVYKQVLLLTRFISETEDSVLICNSHKEILLKCDLQNISCIRALLKNIFNLVKNIGDEEQMRLISEYYIKLDYGLAFIAKGINFTIKNVDILNVFCRDARPRGNGIFYDDISFVTISLGDIENCVH